MNTISRENLRNIAIIAHVDHGKTTLVDAMLQQTGSFREGQEVRERALDSNDLERERGITIFAKQASVRWKNLKINIIDTPGHADFGGEVERTLRMADGAILLVDAAEGPLPQTRFVLGKAIELGMPVIVVINKIDRQDARPDEALDEVFGLFCDLGASDEQTDFATLYAIGKQGVAAHSLTDPLKDLTPLFETIAARVPAPEAEEDGPLRFLVHDTQHDEYVGKLAIGRVYSGRIARNQNVAVVHKGGDRRVKVGGLWGFEQMERVRIETAAAGDIAAISGFEDIEIGDTVSDVNDIGALDRIHVEEPTIHARFLINDSPFAGLSGKFVTSRHLRERLMSEATHNIALRVEETETPDAFEVYGRGELMLTILAETMRREGYELSMAMPEVVTREVDGKKEEPVELVVIDVPDEHVGSVTQALGERRGHMLKMGTLGANRSRIEFRVPSRGLIGFRSLFLTLTRGTGLLNAVLDGWEPYGGPKLRRKGGAIVSDRKGRTTPYALFNLQPRGVLFIDPGTEVYEGMIVGEHNRMNDIDVYACREKKLTNIRSAGKDDNVVLTPPKLQTIESGLEWIDQDELVEITPASIRLRKKLLECNRRPRRDGPKTPKK